MEGHLAYDELVHQFQKSIFVYPWQIGNIVWRINGVALRHAGFVLRWVTIGGYTVLVFNQATQANSAWSSSVGRRIEYWHVVLVMVTATAGEELVSSA